MTGLSPEIREELRARRGLYGLASRLFAAEIDADLYKRLVALDADECLRPYGPGFVDVKIRALPERMALQELAVEFCRLFVGPQPSCPPYATIQLGQSMVMGRAAQEMEEFLSVNQLHCAIPAWVPILSRDHISVGLAILNYLHGIAANNSSGDGISATEARRLSGELLKDLLLPWAPRYLRLVAAAARVAPYSAVAMITAALLDGEESLVVRSP